MNEDELDEDDEDDEVTAVETPDALRQSVRKHRSGEYAIVDGREIEPAWNPGSRR